MHSHHGGTWWHADRHGAEKVAEGPTSDFTSNGTWSFTMGMA